MPTSPRIRYKGRGRTGGVEPRPYGGYKECGKRAAGDMQEGASLWIFGQKNTHFKSGINLTILRRR